MNEKDNLMAIGYIAGTHGIKGELKLSLNKFIELINPLNDIFLFLRGANDIYTPMKIKKSFLKGANIILQIHDFDHINKVLQFVSQTCYINKDNFDTYLEELVDFTTYNVYEKNKKIGPVLEVMFNGVYELFKIKIGNKEIWVPNVDRYIVDIDNDDKIITMIDSEVLI